jgi:hypothetical protein
MNTPLPKDIFFFVFKEIKFPFFAIDLKVLSEAIATNSKNSPHSFIQFYLKEYKEKKEFIINSLRGIIQGIEVPPSFLGILEASPYLTPFLKDGKSLKTIAESENPFFGIFGDEVVVWKEDTYWPALYNLLFTQLLNLCSFFKYAIEKRKAEISKDKIETQILSEFPRMMPTTIHYAFGSLGAWLGGAVNMQYFSYYATGPQIRDNHINERYLQMIHYDSGIANELSKSGIIGLPANLLLPLVTAQNNGTYFGSLPVDEWNLANLPDTHLLGQSAQDVFEKEQLPGFIMDKYYRTPFRARRPNNQGLLGANSVLRDHYTDFYKLVGDTPLLRCKHYCAPVIEVASFKEIEEYIAKIPLRGNEGIFFRGQTSLYTLPRTEIVKKMLFANSCSVEPSLVTAAARTHFDYDSVHFALKYFLMEALEFRSNYSWPDSSKIIREKQVNASLEIDHAIMALSQHYGIPSHGLDITSNPDVALWFAINKYNVVNNKASYIKLEESDWDLNDCTKWPIIFVCQSVTHTIQPSLHDCHELTDVGITALRPIRQSAKFFLGGHSEHQNRLAETIVCAFRLKPGDYKTTVDFDFLFPSPNDDKAYRLILDFADSQIYKSYGSEKVNRFHD